MTTIMLVKRFTWITLTTAAAEAAAAAAVTALIESLLKGIQTADSSHDGVPTTLEKLLALQGSSLQKSN
jgi:hypothetical protein